MALLGRKKQDARQDTPPAAANRSARQFEPPQSEPSLGASLERKWEEAWRRARAGDYK